jgi:hypothetical protein
MIGRCSNQGSDYISRSITTHGQMRRLPHQGARHSTVDHGDASDGVFLLLHLWVLPSRWAILLRISSYSLSSLWMASWCEWLSLSLSLSLSANGGASRTLGLKILRVQGKGGRTDPRSGPGRPAQAHPDPVRSPLCSRGSSGYYALCPFHFHDFDDVILASKMEVVRA